MCPNRISMIKQIRGIAMISDIWFFLGFVGWIYFLFSITPRDATEWLMGILLVIPCMVGGPLSIVTVSICRKIDPIRS